VGGEREVVWWAVCELLLIGSCSTAAVSLLLYRSPSTICLLTKLLLLVILLLLLLRCQSADPAAHAPSKHTDSSHLEGALLQGLLHRLLPRRPPLVLGVHGGRRARLGGWGGKCGAGVA